MNRWLLAVCPNGLRNLPLVKKSLLDFRFHGFNLVCGNIGIEIAQELFDAGDGATGAHDEAVHIRIQQRNGRKTLTTVQGINPKYDFKKIIKVCKKEFACNGTVVEHPEYGEVIQFQGDQRNHIKDFLAKVGLAKADQIKVHGF